MRACRLFCLSEGDEILVCIDADAQILRRDLCFGLAAIHLLFKQIIVLQPACLAALSAWLELNLPVVVADAAALDLTVTFGDLEMLASLLRLRHVLHFFYEAILENAVQDLKTHGLCFLLSFDLLFQTI